MIKAGMTIAEAIAQLTRGFRKMMQRDPDGLEKIKIKQEAVQKLKDLEKVVDMEGNVIDTSKGIMGGKQMKAMGGRIGLKDGPDLSKRNFMKILGGLAAIPFVGKFFRQADKVAPAAQKVMENFSSTASEAPQYFLDLANKIKLFGKESKIKPQERVNEYNYTGKNGDQYTLTEDISTGDMQITKDKIGIGTYGDKSFDTIEDRTEMVYKKGQADETTKGTPADEYEEYKVEFDQDGTQAGADAIDERIQKEIIEESKEVARDKKASGGIAMMLGQ